MKKTMMTKETAQNTFKGIENVLTLACREAQASTGAKAFVYGSTTGKRGNAGFIIQQTEDFKGWIPAKALLEVWLNEDVAHPHIALRPSKRVKDKLPLATWKKLGFTSTAGGKRDFTFRIRVDRSNSDTLVMIGRIVTELATMVAREERKATKKTTKKTEKKTEQGVA